MINREITEFVLDPSSGYWGLSSKEERHKLKESLGKRIKPPKVYNGIQVIQVIALNTTNSCNLGCIYCSTAKRRSRKSMPLEIAKLTIEQTNGLEEIPKIVFHGSEPLLNMGLVEETVLYGEDFYKKNGKQIYFSIQTNLTTLTQKKIDFLKQHQVGISTSLDGGEQEHNQNRPYKDGSPSYNDVVKGIKSILEFQKGICAVCTVTKNNVKCLDEIVLEFENIGISEVQFLPAVDCNGNGIFMPSNEELSKSYIRLFKQTFQRIRDNSQKIIVKDLSQYLSAFFLPSGIDSCRICTPSNQHSILAVDTDGNIYPCDFFLGDEEKSIGNVKKDSFVSILNSQDNLRMQPIEETYCGKCDWRNICGGGCLGDRIFSKGKPYYCDTHKAIFEYFSKNVHSWLNEGIIRKIFEEEKNYKNFKNL